MTKAKKQPKLPVRQLLILSICRIAEPVALSSVFPYLPEMIESFNVPKTEVAKWAGITSAVFSLSQCVTGIAWGRASDRFGRKPVVLVGLICTMAASLCFGLSKSLTWAIASRGLAGGGSGTVGIYRTMVAEMVTAKALQPRAFSIMPLIWIVGSIFGPTLGGALAKPVTKYPAIFGPTGILADFPFLLPNLVACGIFVCGLSTGVLFLKETLETKKHKRDYGRVAGKLLTRCLTRKKQHSKWHPQSELGQASPLLRYHGMSFADSDSNPEFNARRKETLPQAPPGWREVFHKQSNLNILAYSILALHSVAYDQVLAVFMHLPLQLDRDTDPNVHLPFKFAGGFGLDSGRIGLLFTLYGFLGMILQFVVFPPLARRYGVLRCLKGCSMLFPVAYILTPFTVLLPTSNMRQIVLLCIMNVKLFASIFAFPCTTILMTNSAGSLRLLGTLNGVATSLSALGRAAGPSIAGITFTIGVKNGYIILPWWILAGFAILGIIPVWWIIEMDGFGDGDDSDSDEEEEEEETDPVVAQDNDEGRSTGVAGIGFNNIAETQAASRPSEDDFAVEQDPLLSVVEREPRSLTNNDLHSSDAPTVGHMTVPLGGSVRPGAQRRLSDGLGQSMNSYHA